MRLDGLLPALILGAWIVGVALLVAARLRRRARPAARLVALALALLATLLLWFPSEAHVGRLVWVRGLEPMGLQASGVGLHLAVMVFWALVLAQTAPVLARWAPFLRDALPEAAPPPGAPHYGDGLAFLISGLAAAALTIDHFLGRVVLLDLTSLLTALTLWLGAAPDEGPRPTGAWPHLARYLVFRLADMALFLMVLLLYLGADTFFIDDMLAAAPALSRARLLVALLGGLLAGWVKLGLPPFQGWVEVGLERPPTARVAALGSGLPILGAYLLYRLQPLLKVARIRLPLALVGGLLCAWAVLDRFRRRRERPADAASLLTLHAALGLMLVGTAAGSPAAGSLTPMRLYLLTFLPLRLGACLMPRRPARDGPARLDRAVAPTFAWLNALARATDALEARGLETLVGRLASGVLALASLGARVVEGSLEAFVNGLAEGVLELAARVARVVEEGLFEAFVGGVVAGARRLVWRLKRLHTGHLRRNVAWALLALISLIIIAMLLPLY
ncbi:MAG: hypothetical protein JXA74_09680 [Anaerolineae bacterium]|nr:hypothetical protein [Anaerolineae bacterium]